MPGRCNRFACRPNEMGTGKCRAAGGLSCGRADATPSPLVGEGWGGGRELWHGGGPRGAAPPPPPPLLGGGGGGGGRELWHGGAPLDDPHPRPLPTRGGEEFAAL